MQTHKQSNKMHPCQTHERHTDPRTHMLRDRHTNRHTCMRKCSTLENAIALRCQHVSSLQTSCWTHVGNKHMSAHVSLHTPLHFAPSTQAAVHSAQTSHRKAINMFGMSLVWIVSPNKTLQEGTARPAQTRCQVCKQSGQVRQSFSTPSP